MCGHGDAGICWIAISILICLLTLRRGGWGDWPLLSASLSGADPSMSGNHLNLLPALVIGTDMDRSDCYVQVVSSEYTVLVCTTWVKLDLVPFFLPHLFSFIVGGFYWLLLARCSYRVLIPWIFLHIKLHSSILERKSFFFWYGTLVSENHTVNLFRKQLTSNTYLLTRW